ncbi:MAG: glycosyl transferase [Mesorhizobium sp.]|nr:glycosyl transferase [Mesorhizobium sp. M2A.F.Ca.ET.046.03.2.1]RVC65219.1 glycosyl transferase [Mesorhizobium sp. M00.F.Ca.ET.038.03.1.1]RVC72904.1 glycosyl transferase [Mesorhizobium sp. M2A.F.Ca.ET.046.02.1.1]RWB43664.1 MAG: glycosyl transferase [Mesorhizobium sp.]RWX69514.1 glycosyl transferase [Mesorhizobium sp. M2A.F.Ca.ET.039.01.1.1]
MPLIMRARMRDRAVSKAPRFKLAACAIFREEAPFLAEWIRFHQGVGFEHFYLYNNFSTDDFKAVLDPFIQQGLVTLVDWPRPVGQLSAYRDCIRRRWREALWIGFFDIDEFLFAPDGRDVPSVLRDYRDLPGVCVWQAFYGSSGHVERPERPLVEAFTMRAGPNITTVKTILNPRMVYRPGVHQSKFLFGEGVDTDRRTIVPGMPPKLDILRINHYWSRSLADLDQKIRRGDASTSTPRDRDWHFDFESKLNVERDETILEAMQRQR